MGTCCGSAGAWVWGGVWDWWLVLLRARAPRPRPAAPVAKLTGGCSVVAVAGVSGGGGDPLRAAVVEVDVILLGGGQYC
jgi:hypothetical protein